MTDERRFDDLLREDAAALWHSYGSDAYSLRQTALQVFDG